jgi:hypothetical protein
MSRYGLEMCFQHLPPALARMYQMWNLGKTMGQQRCNNIASERAFARLMSGAPRVLHHQVRASLIWLCIGCAQLRCAHARAGICLLGCARACRPVLGCATIPFFVSQSLLWFKTLEVMRCDVQVHMHVRNLSTRSRPAIARMHTAVHRCRAGVIHRVGRSSPYTTGCVPIMSSIVLLFRCASPVTMVVEGTASGSL